MKNPGGATETSEATVSGLGRFGWAMFDWANQPFFTLVTTFIFAPYFATVVVGDAILGQAQWGYAQGVAGVLIACLSPIFGAVADAHGPRKPWILGFQVLCVVACAGLWLALPGAPGGIVGILALVVVATVAAEVSIVFNNAMMPSLVPEARLGRLSGQAWGLGYVGGLASLFLVLFAFALPETPLFGLDKGAHEHDRIVGPLAALWIVVFVAPLFLFTPDAARSGAALGTAVRSGLGQLARTIGEVRRYRNLALFLVARMLYIDGLSAIFAFGGIYAAGSFGWGIESLGVFGIIILLFAAVGAFAGGWLDDRLGSKRTALIAVVGLLVATFGVVSISVEPLAQGGARHSVLFLVHYDWPAGEHGLFASLAERLFLGFGIGIGVFGGPLQAASRTMLARLAPMEMMAEFYGLYALSGKATAFLAPFVVAAMTQAFASQRAGIASILPFLVLGFVLLLGVREERAEALG
jgi:UMF1 family MFS transporter